jgi:apolipoprotein N-acyltransferase
MHRDNNPPQGGNPMSDKAQSRVSSTESPAKAGRFVIGLGLSIVSGILLYLSFPPFDLGYLAWVAFVPVIVAQFIFANTDWQGKLFQALTWAILMGIILLETFSLGYLRGDPVGFLPLVGVLIVGGIIFLLGIPNGTVGFHRRTGYRFFLLFPAVGWVGFEYLRHKAQLGHLWGMLYISQHNNLPLIQLASLGGVWLVSFIVIVANYALGLAVITVISGTPSLSQIPSPTRGGGPGRSPEPVKGWGQGESEGPNVRRILAIAVAIVLVAHGVGFALLGRQPAMVRVAAVQVGGDLGDFPEFYGRWSRRDWPGMAEAVLDGLEPLTREAAAQGAKLVVWPEASLWLDPQDHPETKARLVRLVQETGIYLVSTHFILPEEGNLGWWLGFVPGMRNEATLISPDGEFLGVYGQDHPIPFTGEAFITERTYPTYQTPFGTLATIICYDNAFTDTTRKLVRKGAQVVAHPTHDFHPMVVVDPLHDIFRAVENRVSIVKADWRYGSAIIDPYGRVLAASPTDRRTKMVLMADVPVPSSSGTLYTKTGDWFGILCFLGMVAFVGYDFSWKWKRQ